MKKYFFILSFLFLVIIAFGVWFYWEKIGGVLPMIETLDSKIQEVQKEIFNPPPLRGSGQYKESALTSKGVIEYTNMERQKNGLLPLKENFILNDAARKKAEDMLENQYFAHVSPFPLETGVSDLAKEVGYDYLIIGENLAMGNFKDDQDLVLAWMASQGHRENILNEKYKEIGVAVLKGVFEGETTWLAVQHFGTPVSACPEPDEKLKEQISQNYSQVKDVESELREIELQIRKMPRWSENYKNIADQYNNLVIVYNNLISQTKVLISQYNGQVQEFNDCLQRL